MGLAQTSKSVMELKSGFVVCVGPYNSMIYGGPFKQYVPGQRRLVGVKMAAEINAKHDISIPTRDFDVPPVEMMQAGLVEAVKAIASGNDIYVGCMGGIGRTGLFMGCLIKSLQDADEPCFPPDEDPVLLVRELYYSHAVETDDQMRYVRGFDSAPVVEAILQLSKPREVEVPVEVVREVEKVLVKTVYVPTPMTPWQSIKALFGFNT